jgi:hypothetical protein
MIAVMLLSGQIADAGWTRIRSGAAHNAGPETPQANWRALLRHLVRDTASGTERHRLVGGYQHLAVLNRWYPPKVHPLYDQGCAIPCVGNVTEGQSRVCLHFPEVSI